MMHLLWAAPLLVPFVLVSAGIMLALGDRKVNILAWVWCFPQQFIGWLLKVATHAEPREGYHAYKIKSGSVSLGEYIFLCPTQQGDETVLKHEQGHTKQSYILGWLWLPIIGVPSIIWAGCFGWLRKKKKIDYYSFYTEKWADKLGGVER